MKVAKRKRNVTQVNERIAKVTQCITLKCEKAEIVSSVLTDLISNLRRANEMKEWDEHLVHNMYKFKSEFDACFFDALDDYIGWHEPLDLRKE